MASLLGVLSAVSWLAIVAATLWALINVISGRKMVADAAPEQRREFVGWSYGLGYGLWVLGPLTITALGLATILHDYSNAYACLSTLTTNAWELIYASLAVAGSMLLVVMAIFWVKSVRGFLNRFHSWAALDDDAEVIARNFNHAIFAGQVMLWNIAGASYAVIVSLQVFSRALRVVC